MCVFTFSIVFRLKQPLHVEGKMKRLDIIQCVFKKSFFGLIKLSLKFELLRKVWYFGVCRLNVMKRFLKAKISQIIN